MEIRNSCLEIYSDKVNEEACFIILSDVHFPSKNTKEKLELVYEKVARISSKNKKVYICIAGDLIDDVNVFNSEDAKFITDYCKKLASLSNVYMIFGNHDIGSFNEEHTHLVYEDWLSLRQNIPGFNYLDSPYEDEEVSISGLNMPIDWYEDEKESDLSFNKKINKMPKLKGDKFNMFLFHSARPLLKHNKLALEQYNNVFNNEGFFNDVDLIGCGHTHGGLLPNIGTKLLNGRGLILPEQPLFPQGCGGLRSNDKTMLVISRGITKITSFKMIGVIDPLYKIDINTVIVKPKVLVKR